MQSDIFEINILNRLRNKQFMPFVRHKMLSTIVFHVERSMDNKLFQMINGPELKCKKYTQASHIHTHTSFIANVMR